jgi:NAD(P)-dependent dehydrogenase (short-subunit alcohol dehydrogenase family)
MSQASSHPSLNGKVALITGGTSGIGRAAALQFHAAGAHVVITGRSESTLESARRELPEGITVLRADARSVQDAEAVARSIQARFGRLDVLFLNAGIAQLAPIDAIDEAHYEEHMNVNVKGVLFTLQKVLPLLSAGSSVIVTSSIAANKASPNLGVYGASKAAVSALVRTFAAELAPRGVRINSISPGPTHTQIQAKFGLPSDVQAAVERDFASKIPLGRFGAADEVARVALFLASAESSYVTGAELSVDGGLLVA